MTGLAVSYICLKKQNAMNKLRKAVQCVADKWVESLLMFLLCLFVGLCHVIYLETFILKKYPSRFLFRFVTICYSFPEVRDTS